MDPTIFFDNVGAWSKVGFPPWLFVMIWGAWLVNRQLRGIHDALQEHIKVTERRLLRLEIERELNEG